MQSEYQMLYDSQVLSPVNVFLMGWSQGLPLACFIHSYPILDVCLGSLSGWNNQSVYI